MSSIAPEHQEGAQMTRGRGNPAAGAKTQILPAFKPTRSWKIIQKVGICSPDMPRSNAEDMYRWGSVVVAGGHGTSVRAPKAQVDHKPIALGHVLALLHWCLDHTSWPPTSTTTFYYVYLGRPYARVKKVFAILETFIAYIVSLRTQMVIIFIYIHVVYRRNHPETWRDEPIHKLIIAEQRAQVPVMTRNIARKGNQTAQWLFDGVSYI
jgi:hypothetical protein